MVFFFIPIVEYRISALYERPFRQNDCYLNLRFFVSVNFERISKTKFKLVSAMAKIIELFKNFLFKERSFP